MGMMEDVVLEKLRKLAIVKYDGRPETVRDFEANSHYFLYIWDHKSLEEEYEWRMVKASTLDMWFEGKFEMKEKITLDDLYKKTAHERCSGCEEGQEQYTPPPDDGKTTYIC